MRHCPGLEDRPTQTDRIVALLRERSPEWVPLPDILNLRISQYGARLHQARHQWGPKIESRVEIVDGKKHSWFRLIETHNVSRSNTVSANAGGTETLPLFGEGARS